MIKLEIALLVLLFVTMLVIQVLAIPSEKGKQLHEQAKREYEQEIAQEKIARVTKKTLERNAV